MAGASSGTINRSVSPFEVLESEPAADEPAPFAPVESQPMAMIRAIASAQSPIMIEEDRMVDMGAFRIIGQIVHHDSTIQRTQVNGFEQKSRKNKLLSACLTLASGGFTIEQIVL
jgi:hypothetical protein